MRRAINKYIEFHQLEPKEIGEFPREFKIPKTSFYVGEGVDVLYRSDKLNPETGEDEGEIEYIHEHEGGVRVCRNDLPKGSRDLYREIKVPKYIWSTKTLVKLGDCLGFSYEGEDGAYVEAEPGRSKCELYALPSGKALFVVEGRKKISAIIWGGELGVEWRGIVG